MCKTVSLARQEKVSKCEVTQENANSGHRLPSDVSILKEPERSLEPPQFTGRQAEPGERGISSKTALPLMPLLLLTLGAQKGRIEGWRGGGLH